MGLDRLLETDLTIEQIRGDTGALTIFDDIDKISNKDLQAKIDKIKDEVLATGRDHQYTGADIDLIVSNHASLGERRTIEILNQASYVVVFPKGSSDHHLKTLCTKYCGLSREQAKYIKETDGRYVIIHREMPLFVLEEKKCWLV